MLFSFNNDSRPFLPLAANFLMDQKSDLMEIEDVRHEVNFDFQLNALRQFRVLRADEPTEKILRSFTVTRDFETPSIRICEVT